MKYTLIIPTLANHKFFYDCVKNIYENSSLWKKLYIKYYFNLIIKNILRIFRLK
ncbi:MAG: hypothetical protein ACP5IO_05190 [Elusimicrobiales bacterium]